MPLLLALHDGDAAAAAALEQAVWQLSESHWVFGTGLLVLTGVSPAYLSTHLTRALEAAGSPASLLVTPLAENASLDGLPPEGRDWAAAALAEG
ncbi:hypothetical protein ACE7GA_21780 [Roseomonas sp. CCTCC AB2023176]|uniref:hypothetical protein n=1 Tax=Roseomonas sp. CCTCC AB2023176 TaxID=3342640 RepID=UPI0035DEA816